MADDLIIKFFREDLTESEEAALSDRLKVSTEEALRFGQHAEASYRHYGLPEPEWPGNPPKGLFGPTGLKLGLVLLAGLSGWAGWKYWPGRELKLSASVSPALTSTLKASRPLNSSQANKPSEKEVIPDRLKPESNASASSETQGSNPPVSTELTPVNVAAQPHHPHTNLEVQVKRAKPGEVTVRVLGPDGSQAVVLYQGMLQPGNWAFDWNGRLANGDAPVAGTYQIQVVSGAVTLSKSVLIRK
jgi:hypothetical protein